MYSVFSSLTISVMAAGAYWQIGGVSVIINKDRSEIEDFLKARLSKKRFKHVIGVTETAVHLAGIHGESPEKAELAGLFHDCAKNLSPGQLLEIAELEKLCIDDLERRQPGLLHAKVGVWIARTEFGLVDNDIIRAIESHTTGREGMGNLEKIIFVSDYAEPNRRYHGCDAIRKLAEKDLDMACLETVKAKMEHILSRNQQIHPDAVSAWNWLVNTIGIGGQ